MQRKTNAMHFFLLVSKFSFDCASFKMSLNYFFFIINLQISSTFKFQIILDCYSTFYFAITTSFMETSQVTFSLFSFFNVESSDDDETTMVEMTMKHPMK